MGNRPTTLRSRVLSLVGKLPPPRDDAAVLALRSAKRVLTGQPERLVPAKPATVRAAPYGLVPGPPLPPVAPIAPVSEWIQPAGSPKTGLAKSIYSTGSKPRRYDVDLLEELNEEYRDKPVVPAPRGQTGAELAGAARGRVAWAHNMIDLRDKTVLELGCGNGYEIWSIARNLGADAYGVDVIQPHAWEDLVDDRVHFACADLTVDNPFQKDMFDRIISYTVWEHVVHPHRLLEETFDILKPGGLQWIRANLWAGPLASHRYREIFFPWPHLLFSDDVISEWDRQHGRTTQGSAWVNKLSWNHYERYIHDLGYRRRALSFQTATWDDEFYRRFEDVLGRIPRTDLERDFFLAVLQKPAR